MFVRRILVGREIVVWECNVLLECDERNAKKEQGSPVVALQGGIPSSALGRQRVRDSNRPKWEDEGEVCEWC